MNALVLVAAVVLQQPLAPPPQDSGGVGRARQSIREVGFAVAEVRSALELFRRAAFNSTDAVTAGRALVLQRRCTELANMASEAPARICQDCFPGNVQLAINRYRSGMSGLRQVGVRCSSALARSLRADSTGARAKREVRSVSEAIVVGLRPYEGLVHGVRVALGIEAPSRPPTQPRRPPG